MIEELRPLMNETRILVRETRWKMDVYAKATRSNIETFGFVRHETKNHVFPRGTYIVFGRHISFLVLRKEQSATGVLLSRRLSSISLEQWEGINCHLRVAWGSNGDEGFTLWGERHANAKYLQDFAMDPSTSRWWMRVSWFPQSKDPIEYDLSTNTNISNN